MTRTFFRCTTNSTPMDNSANRHEPVASGVYLGQLAVVWRLACLASLGRHSHTGRAGVRRETACSELRPEISCVTFGTYLCISASGRAILGYAMTWLLMLAEHRAREEGLPSARARARENEKNRTRGRAASRETPRPLRRPASQERHEAEVRDGDGRAAEAKARGVRTFLCTLSAAVTIPYHAARQGGSHRAAAADRRAAIIKVAAVSRVMQSRGGELWFLQTEIML